MKRTITTLMVCVSAYALIAQEAFKLSKQQMYEDFDQLVTIVEQYNPQVKIKKLVCNYDIVSYINDRRCLVDTIESLGSFACFLETTIKMVHDIHTKKLRLKKNNELVGPSLFQLSNSKFTFAMECDIDFTEISDALDCYQDNPEILVQTSLEEEIMRNFFHPKYIYSEQYLFNKDTFLQSVFNHR